MRKRRVAVVGATGIAGQQFLSALVDHPWFEVAGLAASSRTAGKPYREAIRDASGARRWFCREEPPEAVLDLVVEDAERLDAGAYDVVFSAVEAEPARELEPKYALTTPVLSTASAFRYEEDTPVVVPGVNVAAHLPLLEHQRKRRGWKGFVLPQSNCTVVCIVVSLKPLLDAVGVQRVLATTMQGLSGAGRSPGVIALDVVDNLIPYIPKEEEKVAREAGKILGRVGDGCIEPHPAPVGATCTRAAVLDGHTAAVTVQLEKSCSPDEAAALMRAWRPDYAGLDLPSAPRRPITVHDDPFRPQPRLDRDLDGGMSTSVGRLREEPALERGLKYVALAHNTQIGAAKGQVLVAEHLLKLGLL
jgi:aspartate-semialdehyde dehydrogenase